MTEFVNRTELVTGLSEIITETTLEWGIYEETTRTGFLFFFILNTFDRDGHQC